MRARLVLATALALTSACRLDKLLETPRPPGLGVAPSRVAESADSGSGDVPVALAVSSGPSRVIRWSAHIENGAAWLRLTDDSGSTPDTLRFTLATGLAPNTYRDAVILVPDSAATPNVRVPVELRIDPVPATSGDLRVIVATTGGTPDPDGYTVGVDGNPSRAIAVNDTTIYTALASGSYTVQVGDLASNCSVSNGSASRSVTVPAGGTATVTFAVACPTPPAQNGDLTVSASTTGGTPDPNGYTVTVNGQGRAIGANDSTTYTLAAGSYTVTLGDIAANCTVSGGPSRSGVSVTASNVTRVTFTVSCPTPPPTTGNLTVSNTTTGGTPDPNGYTVTVNGGQSQPLAVNGSTTYTALAAGTYSVELTGVAANCTVSGQNPRSVNVPAGTTASTTFAVDCPTPPPTTGALAVTASTTGGTPDPDGYTVTVDGGQAQTITVNGSTTYTGLAAGSHSVALTGVAANCTVSGLNPRSVTVTAGSTASTTFAVDCPTPPPTTGDLTVAASTTGGTPDPDGYAVAVDGGASRPITINGSTTFTGLTAGSHSVALTGLAANCTVSGANPRSVNVTAGSTASTTFAVDCPTPPPPTGDLTVSASTTGGTPDPNGYTVTVDGGQARTIAINGSTTYSGLATGSHSVELTGLAANCTVSGANPRSVTVTAGSTASTTFAVDCPTPPPPTGDLTVSASTTGGTPDPNGYTVTVDGAQAQTLTINGSTTYTGLAAGSHSVELTGLAANCTVSGQNPRSVNVPAGSTASTTFAVDCPTPPPPPATRLQFTEQPPGIIVLSTTFSVTVTALNAQGGVATGFTGTVQVTLQGPIGLGGLTGTTQVNAVGGVARFTNLRVTGLCVGCSLVATASGLSDATSSTFNVILGQ